MGHSGDLLKLVFVCRRAWWGFCHAVRVIINALNTARPIVTIFELSVRHLYSKKNQTCEIHDSSLAGVQQAGQNMQKSKIFKILPLYSNTWCPLAKLWNSWPWVSGSCSREGPIFISWLVSEEMRGQNDTKKLQNSQYLKPEMTSSIENLIVCSADDALSVLEISCKSFG